MSSPYGYVAYIDEAGDDGIGRFHAPGAPGQSHWLVLSACIVDADKEKAVPSWRDEISAAFPKRNRRDIHFRSLDHGQRVHAAHVIARKPIGAVTILSNKQTIERYPSLVEACEREVNVLYKYLLRYVLEKVSDCVRRACGKRPETNPLVKIVFSRRGGMDYADFQQYLSYLKALQQTKGSYYPIHWRHIHSDLISAEDHSTVAGLQLADVVASSFFQAVETNRYGHTEPRYALALAPCVMRSSGGLRLYYGVRPVPGLGGIILTPSQQAFFSHWKKKRQAPGP